MNQTESVLKENSEAADQVSKCQEDISQDCTVSSYE